MSLTKSVVFIIDRIGLRIDPTRKLDSNGIQTAIPMFSGSGSGSGSGSESGNTTGLYSANTV